MPSINDPTVPGQPATNLTGLLDAFRAVLNRSDTTVDARIAAAVPTAAQSPYITWSTAGISDGSGLVAVTWPAQLKGLRPFVQATPVTSLALVVVQFIALTTAGGTVQVSRRDNGTVYGGVEVHILAMVPR